MTQAERKNTEDRLNELLDEVDKIVDALGEIQAMLENAEPKPKPTGWAGRDDNRCCYISTDFAYDKANIFIDTPEGRAKAEEIAAAQLCYRLLKRFSDENGGEQIDWSNHEQYKHFIYYNAAQKTLAIDWDVTDPQINVVYFASEEICQQAIDLFRPQIMAAMGIKEDA